MADLDLIVIGTGVAGSTVARKCRAAGWEVAIVDSRPYGGTCALRGCDPKKVLVEAARAVASVRRHAGLGVRGEATLEWSDLVEFERTFTRPVPGERERSLADAGIRTLHGRARFVDPVGVEVDGERVEARQIVIATGARPRSLPFPGAELVTTSDDFLVMDRLPRRIAFVGGGFVSFEFAHVAARGGAESVVLEAQARVLEPFDADLVGALVERSAEIGIEVRTSTRVVAVERDGDEMVVRTESAGSGKEEIRADLVVHGAGRVPEIDDLGLDAAGVERTEEGIEVNGFLQSVSNPAVYGAGDAVGAGPPLTPVASHQAEVVVTNLLEGNHRRFDHHGIPAVVYTIPPLAAVGLGEVEARDRGIDVEIRHRDTSGWASTRRAGEPRAGFKVLIDRSTDRIAGAHLLGPGADETINLFGLAIRRGLTVAELAEAPLAYPTHGSDLGYMIG